MWVMVTGEAKIWDYCSCKGGEEEEEEEEEEENASTQERGGEEKRSTTDEAAGQNKLNILTRVRRANR